jgi:serine protease
VSITSAGIGGNSSTAIKSGTSMATPHTAGAAALYLEANPTDSPQQVRDALFAHTTKDVVSSSSTTNNDLLFVGFIGGGSEPPPPPPDNRAPTAVDDATETDAGVAVSIDVLSNDGDLDDDPLSVTDLGSPADGTAVVNANGTVTYTPRDGFDGTDTFTYRASDGRLSSELATVTVTVRAIATPPPEGGIDLTVMASKVRGRHAPELVWSGASGANVDIYESGALLTTTPNDGAYTHATENRGGATYRYEVCEAGTTTCSPEVAVSY